MFVCQCLAEASVDSCVVCVYLGSCRRCPVNWLPLKKLVPQRGSSSPMWSCHQWPHLHLSLTGKKQTVRCTFLWISPKTDSSNAKGLLSCNGRKWRIQLWGGQRALVHRRNLLLWASNRWNWILQQYMCAVYLAKWWHQDALCEDDKLVEEVWCSWQCSAWKPWVRHSCVCQVDMSHLLKHGCKPGTPLHRNGIPFGCGLFNRLICPATLHTLFGNGSRNMMKSASCCPVLQIPHMVNLIEHL